MRNLAALPSPTFLKGRAQGCAGRGWPHPPWPAQGTHWGPGSGGVAGGPARVAAVASGSAPANRPPAVPPPFPALPAPPSLLLSFLPSLLPSVPPSLLSFSTASALTPEGTGAGAGSPDRRRRSGTVSPAEASAWPRHERLDPATGTRSGEWGRGATSSPGPSFPGTPPLPKSGWGPGGDVGGGGGKACWRAPPSALHARWGLLTKLHFEINSVAAGASEGYGCHGDGAVRGSPGLAGSGPGSGGATREPQASLQGHSGPAGRIAFWALPPDPPLLYNLRYMCALMGCQWQLGGRGPGVLGGCRGLSSFEDLFLFPVS